MRICRWLWMPGEPPPLSLPPPRDRVWHQTCLFHTPTCTFGYYGESNVGQSSTFPRKQTEDEYNIVQSTIFISVINSLNFGSPIAHPQLFHRWRSHQPHPMTLTALPFHSVGWWFRKVVFLTSYCCQWCWHCIPIGPQYNPQCRMLCLDSWKILYFRIIPNLCNCSMILHKFPKYAKTKVKCVTCLISSSQRCDSLSRYFHLVLVRKKFQPSSRSSISL